MILRSQTARLAVALLVFAPVVAEQHPVRTHFVIDRWMAALGGKERLGRVSSVYVKAVIVRGGEIGTLENWQTAGGEYKTTVMLGDHEIITVCNGKTGWSSVDGSARDLQGEALAGAITRSYLGSYSQFFPERLPGTVEWVGEEADAYVIRIEPAGGTTVRFYLDKKTGLPLMHKSGDDQAQPFTYIEWQDYDGIRTWKRGRDPEADLTVTVQEVHWNPKLDPKIFDKPGE